MRMLTVVLGITGILLCVSSSTDALATPPWASGEKNQNTNNIDINIVLSGINQAGGCCNPAKAGQPVSVPVGGQPFAGGGLPKQGGLPFPQGGQGGKGKGGP